MRLTMIFAIALLTLLATPALAQPGLAAPGQSPRYLQPAPTFVQQDQVETKTTKYGLEVFAADAASWAVLIAAGSGDSEGLATIGAFGMVLGGPVVHLARGNTSGAGYSLLARTALPVGGVLLGLAACDGSDGYECLGTAFLGGMTGYGSALVIDWFFLAEKTEVVGPQSGWASVRPSLQVAPSGAQAGLAGTF
jgi:hypothetical protein